MCFSSSNCTTTVGATLHVFGKRKVDTCSTVSLWAAGLVCHCAERAPGLMPAATVAGKRTMLPEAPAARSGAAMLLDQLVAIIRLGVLDLRVRGKRLDHAAYILTGAQGKRSDLAAPPRRCQAVLG